MAAQESLELRLERIKRIGNLRLDFLERLYQGGPFVEGYIEGRSELHLHLVSGICVRYRIKPSGKTKNMDNRNEIVMLMKIAKKGEVLRPFTSLERLQPLDSCYMGWIEPLKLTGTLSEEILWRAFDRKLGSLGRNPGIELAEVSDQIIQRRPEAINRLPGKHTTSLGDGCIAFLDDVQILSGSGQINFRLDLNDGSFILGGANLGTENLKLKQMFACPVPLDVGILQ